MAAGVAASALAGLLVGSFLNVVAHRVPRGESVLRPASRCPGCGHAIRPRDNVPVLSWLLLRGRCRDCDHPVSARYPLVELLTGLSFLTVAVRFGWSWELPAYLYLAAVAVALSVIDVDVQRLPDAIVLPSYVVMAGLLLVPAAVGADWGSYLRALVGAVALFAFYFALAVVHPAGMGFGDVKLAGVLGMALGWLGWPELLAGAFLGFLYGGLLGGALMLLGRATRRSAIPFGPFMLAGAFTAVLVGDWIVSTYLQLLTT